MDCAPKQPPDPKADARPALSFRAAAAGDIGDIMSLEQSCFDPRDAYDQDYMNEFLQESLVSPKTPLLLAFAQAAARDGKQDGEKPRAAGYTLGECENSDIGVIGHVISLAVDRDFRGLHLGRQLLERVCESLRRAGAGDIYLEVESTNASAIRLYETSGFSWKKDEPDYYGEGRDAIIMVKPAAGGATPR